MSPAWWCPVGGQEGEGLPHFKDFPQPPSIQCKGRGSLPLPEVDVHDAADERQGEGEPSQHEAVPKSPTWCPFLVELADVDSIDHGSREHGETCVSWGVEGAGDESSSNPQRTQESWLLDIPPPL